MAKIMTEGNKDMLMCDVVCDMGNDTIKEVVDELGLITCDEDGNVLDVKSKELHKYLSDKGVLFTSQFDTDSDDMSYIYTARY